MSTILLLDVKIRGRLQIRIGGVDDGC